MRLDLQGTKNVDSKNGKNFHAGYTEHSMWVFVHAVKITKVRVNKKNQDQNTQKNALFEDQQR